MPPKIVLINVKFIQNLGGVVRAAACWGVEEIYWTGNRISYDMDRLPRELRMYKHIKVIHHQYPFKVIHGTPVAVELLTGAESLVNFQHPKEAVYVFGPEDGSLTRSITSLCHRFVYIPTKICLNLSATVNVVMWDRYYKEINGNFS